MDAPVSVWKRYGFRSSPYSTTALGIDTADAELLVGREAELRSVLTDLVSGANLIALEGDYGVGKSSLAAVAVHEATNWTKGPHSPLFLSAGRPLELAADDSTFSFEKRVFFGVAGAILPIAPKLLNEGFRLEQVAEFKQWLASPSGSGWSAGIGVSFPGLPGMNMSAGRTRSPNGSVGFSDAGAITLIDSWLSAIYSNVAGGGVICMLDNLEVLGRSRQAIELFESLRDRLFKRDGLRWIVGGAEGMVRTALSTPKMSGTFSDPVDLRPLPHNLVPEVVRRRARHFSARADSLLPVSPEALEKAYLATGRNLRFALSLAERFSLRADHAALTWAEVEVRDDEFDRYLYRESAAIVSQLAKRVTKVAWDMLITLINDKDGTSTPSEFADFGFNNQLALLAHIKTLKAAGLLAYTVDSEDARRRNMVANDKGRLAVISKMQEP